MRTRVSVLLTLCTVFLFAAFALAESKDVKIVKGPVVEHTGEHTAVIAWSTNASASTIVRYGTDANKLDRTAQMPWGGLTHRVTIKDLQPGTTYYFRVDSDHAQGSGTSAQSQTDKSTTQGPQNASNGSPGGHAELKLTHGPVLEHVGDTTAVVAWSTDLPSSSIVRYGTDANHLDKTAEQPWGATTHRVEIKNLKPGTRYYYTVHSAQGKNAPGQKVDTEARQFTTATAGQNAKK